MIKLYTLLISVSDINECIEATYVCPDNAKCNNTDGAYECYCEEGYREEIRMGETVCVGKEICQFMNLMFVYCHIPCDNCLIYWLVVYSLTLV